MIPGDWSGHPVCSVKGVTAKQGGLTRFGRFNLIRLYILPHYWRK